MDVKKIIKGDWKLKGEAKNGIYRFSFDTGAKDFLEVLKELNLPPKAQGPQSKNYTIVNIKLENEAFFIELIYPFGKTSEKILVLDKENFVFGQGESKRVFVKDQDYTKRAK
ncbi:hypothetical protein [Flavivirga spongiicola]|uniref:hypothetical protein n=1 Tax=Flavivirga spongiicola TaxID=421621 RepID=UPI002FBDFB8E